MPPVFLRPQSCEKTEPPRSFLPVGSVLCSSLFLNPDTIRIDSISVRCRSIDKQCSVSTHIIPVSIRLNPAALRHSPAFGIIMPGAVYHLPVTRHPRICMEIVCLPLDQETLICRVGSVCFQVFPFISKLLPRTVALSSCIASSRATRSTLAAGR